ncbi:hypothetical protein C5745_09880 [Sphingobacterium haloxyli]|uniref:RNA polymerase alpha subunit C-terminal domain-containing protein n=2 Tax=Sphingobacterium haloxyli TaxID=2100533 RepID=A0A2S9J484_9SPHI|nr:hypothetical protein C5745_09880 [Sphingobacterium haloxyli]
MVQLARYMGREPWEIQALHTDPVLTDKIMREPVISLDRFCEEYGFSPDVVQQLIDRQSIYSFRDKRDGKIYIFPVDVYNELVMHENLEVISYNNSSMLRLMGVIFGLCSELLDEDQMELVKRFFSKDSNGIYPKLENREDIQLVTEAIRKLRNGLNSMRYKYKQFEDKIADYERSVSALEKKLDRLTLKHKKVSKKLLDARLVKYADTVPKIAFKDIPISVRALNVLDTLGVYYFSDLQNLTIMELLRARNLGKYSFEEVLKIASKYNIKFKDAQ